MNPEQTEKQTSAANVRVLVVDDVPKNVQMLGSMLRSEGYDVIPAASGAQALRSAATHKPDLILLDVMMPEMNGYVVIQKLREDPSMRDVPVIFVTALTDEEDEAKGLELGAVDYITKPTNIAITKARVKTHLSLRFARMKLEKQNRQLIEAAKLREDVERMSRHDLKTPLSAILASPDLITASGSLTPNQVKVLGVVESSGYRMLEMIDRSLDLYKMETGSYTFKPAPVNLLEVIRKVVGEVQRLASAKRITIQLLLGGDPPDKDATYEVTGEELLCHTMLANLAKNAVEASPEDQTVTVSLQEGEPKAVSIRNEGAVPEEIRDRFFEKYVTSGKERGTGLGTYSARLIAEAQGGSIQLDCSEADATTVTILMPRTANASCTSRDQ